MKSFKEIRSNRTVKFIESFPTGIRFYWRNNKTKFLVMATSDPVHGDHVSISHRDISIKPTFEQMAQLREVCFKENEITHFYMKHDGKTFVRSNCYHIFRKLDEVISA